MPELTEPAPDAGDDHGDGRPHSESSDSEWDDHDEVSSFWEEQDRNNAAQKQKGIERASRTADKLLFVGGVTNIVLLAAFFFNLHEFMAWYYTIKFPTLIALRWRDYSRQKWHLFLFDLCYFANTFILVTLWVFPKSTLMLDTAYALATGPLLWAALAFRNSLVFHSLDKVTSCFIHVSPALTMYVVHWYPAQASKHWHTTFADTSDTTSFRVVPLGLAVFVTHQILYYIVVQVILINRIRHDKRYLTSFRFLSADKGGVVHRFISLLGRKYRVLMWGVLNLIYCALTLCLVPLWHKYQEAGLIVLVFICAGVTWNGAGFYIHVFSKRYEQEVKERAAAKLLEQREVSPA